MSTNYYFINKESRKETEAHNNKVDELFKEFSQKLDELERDAYSREIDSVKWKYELDEHSIHIGKRSMGWLPLFEACEYFESIREMKKWYLKNQDDYIIENEYNEELSWAGLKEELIDWKGVKSHFDEYSPYISYFADEDGYEWTRSSFS